MRALRKCAVAALGCLVLLGLSPLAHAATGAQAVQLLPKVKFSGAGSPGFLPFCSGNFSLQNYAYESNSFGAVGGAPTSPWAVSNSGSTNPSFTSTTDTAPDGSATATDVTFGAISGTTKYSLLTQSVGSGPFAKYYNWTEQLWVRDLDGPGTGNLSLSIYTSAPATAGQNYVTVKIPNDGQWHLVVNYIPANWTTATSVTFQVGPDGRDTSNQSSAVGVKHLAIWNAQFAEGHSEGGKGWPYFANTTSTGTPTTNYFVLRCPPTIAFRDFSRLKPWIAANPTNPAYQHGITNITIQSSTNQTSSGGLYEQGGLGNPFAAGGAALQVSGTYAGQLCGFTSTTDGISESSPATHNAWPTSVLFCGKNIFSFAEAQIGKPQLMIPAYVLATSGQKGGTPPCSATCAGSQASIPTANVSVGSSGVVTVTLTTAINAGPGATITVSGFGGTNASYVNGTYHAISPTGGGTTTVTYQSGCSSGCSVSLTGTGTVVWSVPWNSYTLHGWWLQGGCNGGYVYCLLFSAEVNADGGGGPSTFLAYSNTIDSLWCVYGTNGLCNNGSPSASGGPTNTQPTGLLVSANSYVQTGQLPAVIPVNGVNYAITTPANQAQVGFVIWTSPVGDGVHWTNAGWITQPVFTTTGGGVFSAADWDSGASRIDPAIYQNKCGPGGVGYFEFFQTSYKANLAQGPTGNVKNQGIGYYVASDIRGPYYHFNGPGPAPLGNGSGTVTGQSGAILPFNSQLYNGQTTIGETNVFDQNGTLFWTGNTDSGIGYSSGVGGYLPDACQ